MLWVSVRANETYELTPSLKSRLEEKNQVINIEQSSEHVCINEGR